MGISLQKILLITSRADFGGGPQHLYLLLKYLKNQFDFFVACPNDFPYKQRFEDLLGKEKIILIPHRKFETKVLKNLKSFCKKKSIALIHSHGKGAGVYGRLLSLITFIPCVHTFHGFHIDEYNTLQKQLYLNLERFFSFFTKVFITVSNSEFKRIAQFKITSPNKIIIIENGVEMDEKVDADKIANEEFHQVITFTRFDYAKNTELLLPIMEYLREKNEIKYFRFIILGSGLDEAKLKTMVSNRSLDKYVTFKGAVGNPSEYLKESFCYISTSRWEGMPLGVLEAMAAGLPIIATDVTGNRDAVINNSNGFLFDIDSPGSASEYLVQLKNNLELWKVFSEVSVSRINKYFGADIMASKTANIYSNIFNSK